MSSPCLLIQPDIAAFVDGELDAETRLRLERHLAECASCQQSVTAQSALKDQLHLVALRETRDLPPEVWQRALAAWDARDAQKRARGQVRWAFASACLLLFGAGVVWARLAVNHTFPIAAVMRDYQSVQTQTPTPRYATRDADAAARWLRHGLEAETAPLNLSLSRAQLLGADILTLGDKRIGRLLYRTPQSVCAIYLVPDSTRFVGTTPIFLDEHTFQIKDDGANSGMYGWATGNVGYGLMLPQPVSKGHALAINAERASEQPAVR